MTFFTRLKDGTEFGFMAKSSRLLLKNVVKINIRTYNSLCIVDSNCQTITWATKLTQISTVALDVERCCTYMN